MEQVLTEEQEIETLFSGVSVEEMKIIIAEYLKPFGYIQVDDKQVHLAFRNEELDLDIRIQHETRRSYKILIKRDTEWVTVNTGIRRHNIAESVKSQGIVEFRELMRGSGQQSLLQLGLLLE